MKHKCSCKSDDAETNPETQKQNWAKTWRGIWKHISIHRQNNGLVLTERRMLVADWLRRSSVWETPEYEYNNISAIFLCDSPMPCDYLISNEHEALDKGLSFLIFGLWKSFALMGR